MNKQHHIVLYYKTGFSAAHRYYDDSLSEAENSEKFGLCTNIHGHNFSLTLGLQGPINPVSGMLINFFDVENIVKKTILQTFDYSYLNLDVDYFKKALPTCENLSRFIFRKLKEEFEKPVTLVSVNVSEDDTLNAEFRKD